MRPLGVSRPRRIAESEYPRDDGTRWRKPRTRPPPSVASANRASGVGMQVVHRHREAAVGGAGEPLARDGVDVRPLATATAHRERRPERRSRRARAGPPTGAPCGCRDPRARTGGIEHRLVAASKRAQPAGAVEVEPAAGCVQDDESPAALAAHGAEVVYEAGYRRPRRRSDRPPRARSRPRPGRRGRRSRPGEHVPAVAPKREEREAVVAVGGDESPGAGVIRVRLAARLTMRAQPLVQGPEGAGGEHELEPEVGDPVQVLIGRRADDGPCGERDGEAGKQRPQAGRIAGDVEPAAQAKERDEERDAPRGFLDVESCSEVGQGSECDDGERGHPCPVLAPGERRQRATRARRRRRT